jgi:assimilatory nitrate reductase catalytic subunit
MRLRGGDPPEVSGDESFRVNRGQLCIKGYTSAAALRHRERLSAPLVRGADGSLHPASWDEAVGFVCRRLSAIRTERGADAVGVFGSGALTNEKAYLLGKFARVALGTSNIDYNGRYCMSSAAAACNQALGLDRGLPFPVEDICRSEVVLLAGANIAETMPPLMQYFEEQRSGGGHLIVVDPRRSKTAEAATHHLSVVPGSDGALAHGLLHVLVRDGLVDAEYIEKRTVGFERVRTLVAGYWPERVERITGVPEAQLVEVAHLLGRARSVMVLTGRGPEQQAQGVAQTLAYINLSLAVGAVGRPFSGYGCLTGQGNGQGGREHGQKADQLPGYRRIDDPAARRHLAHVWGVPESSIPGPGRSAYEMLLSSGRPDGVSALLVFGSNPVVSSPDASAIEERLRALDLLVVADFFLSETGRLAHVVLPSAQWAEEDGTLTSLEGRVILRQKAVPPPPGVKTDLEILCALAAGLGHLERFAYDGAEDVFDELRRASAGGVADYSGITWERLRAERGIFWPCPSPGHPGTPRLFTETFPTPDGRARFSAVGYAGPAEEPDEAYPLYLTTGRVMPHYQSGTQTRRIEKLLALAPEATVQMHPSTAHAHALEDGDEVTLSTRRGSARFRVQLSAAIREDTLFVPFHWGGEHSANLLTHPALDPHSRMPEFKVCAVRLEAPSDQEESHT